jgi:DNA-binding NarL/FixJ family response regulator
VSELTDALTRISQGGTVIDPEVVAVLIAHEHRTGGLSRLTDREQVVLALMALGHTNAAIGHELFLSERTVETHINGIFTKLDIAAGPHNNRRVIAVLEHLRHL